jgi:co-chaperonin GroES (HSP10)
MVKPATRGDLRSGAGRCSAACPVRDVTLGDRVLLVRDDQHEVDVDGATYLVLRERELHAVATERSDHDVGLDL